MANSPAIQATPLTPGVYEHGGLIGGWRTIVGRRADGAAKEFHYHVNDDRRHADALRRAAERFVASQA